MPQPIPFPRLWLAFLIVGALASISPTDTSDGIVFHDALGRLVRAQSPHPDPQTSSGELRSERFYYDGVRRIQEVFVDPLEEVEEAMADPQGSSLVLQTVGSETYDLDGKSAPAVFEMAQTGAPVRKADAPGSHCRERPVNVHRRRFSSS